MAAKVDKTIPFTREPLKLSRSGIPIFATTDPYIQNYDKIANKHLKSLDDSGENPFMSEETWSTIDNSTIEILRNIIRPRDVILDAGVGLGAILGAFPDNERHGVDVSLDYLERTTSRGINVSLARLEDLPFPDASFDCVVSTDVLEHVIDFYGATKELVRVLKPQGYLVVRVPLEEDMKAYYDYYEFKFVHLRRFDIWSLRLHFERLLGLQFVLDKPVLPLYRGVSTSRIRPVENGETIRDILNQLPNDMPGVREFTSFTELESDKYESFMNSVAVQFPKVFAELTQATAGYLEINVVFRKN